MDHSSSEQMFKTFWLVCVQSSLRGWVGPLKNLTETFQFASCCLKLQNSFSINVCSENGFEVIVAENGGTDEYSLG